MRNAFTALSPRVALIVSATLMLSVAFVASGIPPRQFSDIPSHSLRDEALVRDVSETVDKQIVIESMDGEQIEVTVAAAKAGPWLGIGSAEASDALDAQLGLPHGDGLVVIVVVTNSPAAKAGLQKNDVLVEFEGQRLVHPVQFRKLLQMKTEGEKVEITLFRGGKKKVVAARLEMPPPDQVLRSDTSDGKKMEMQGHRGTERALKDLTIIVTPAKTVNPIERSAQASAPAVTRTRPKGMSYIQRQGWKADLRTIIAMAKWLVAPEPSTHMTPPVEPITTSITEVVHGRSLGNI